MKHLVAHLYLKLTETQHFSRVETDPGKPEGMTWMVFELENKQVNTHLEDL